MDWAKEYLENWVAPDGGGKLNKDDEMSPFGQSCPGPTTKNENPILFLVQTAIEMVKHYPETIFTFKALYEKHMASTEISPGLHSRRCGDSTIRRQSHDNVVAMLIGGWFFQSEYPMKIFKYGRIVGWNYNVLKPGQFDIKSQLQGGDIAIAHYAVGFTPEIWNVIWLATGLAISTTYNLADLRIEFLEAFMKAATSGQVPLIQKVILQTGILIHKMRRGPRIKWVRKYFGGTEYPFRMVLEDLEKSG